MNQRDSIIHLDQSVIFRETFNSEYAVRNNPYHRGTPTSVTFGKDSNGRYAEFNGTTSKIDYGSDWLSTKPLSIVTSIYANGWGESNVGRIVDNGKFFVGLRLTADEGYVENIWASNNASSIIHSASNSIVLGNWYHVVITRNSSGVGNIYINGAQSGEVAHNYGAPEAGTTNVIIGNNNAQTQTFDGKIYGMDIYDIALTANDAMLLYRGALYL